MAERTGISWTNATWNPIAGCTRVSSGCDICYAAELAAGKLAKTPTYQGLAVRTPSGRAAFNGTIRLLPDRLQEPLRWRDPKRVFVNSMSDLFHDGVPDEFIDQVFAVMALADRHTFQVLTKRPERMLRYLRVNERRPLAECAEARVGAAAMDIAIARGEDVTAPNWDIWWDWPLRNVWLGVSVENQEAANERIPILQDVPAAVRFLSCEPLLGPIDFYECGGRPDMGDPIEFSALRGTQDTCPVIPPIDWVIAGGESGRGYRPMEIAWAQSIHDQCKRAGTTFFMKQDSGSRPGMRGRIPDDLWVQEFPQ